MQNLKNENITRAILTEDGQVMIEQANGSYMPAEKGKTDFRMLDTMQDSNIDFSEIPELSEEFFNSSFQIQPKKEQLTIRIDVDLLEWLKNYGQGYQAKINNILRAYMLVHKKGSL